MSNTVKIVGLLILIVLAVIFGPLLTIWALNVLFPILAIEYTLSTWLAVILLGMFLRSNVSVNK